MATSKVRYRYYISAGAREGTTTARTTRLPSREIKTLVCDELGKLLADPLGLVARASLD